IYHADTRILSVSDENHPVAPNRNRHRFTESGVKDVSMTVVGFPGSSKSRYVLITYNAANSIIPCVGDKQGIIGGDGDTARRIESRLAALPIAETIDATRNSAHSAIFADLADSVVIGICDEDTTVSAGCDADRSVKSSLTVCAVRIAARTWRACDQFNATCIYIYLYDGVCTGIRDNE